jgi:cyclohexa-1,5-dienecarbonyl-CoA hydratase
VADLVRITPIDDGAFWRVRFGASKGNIIDGPTMAALRSVCADARSASRLRAICLEGNGADFSFGASVQEHLPNRVSRMLEDFRHLILDLLDTHVVLLAAVRGQCLGGGLELATACHRIFASADARFGQPEIALGVFPPIASIVLPERIGRAYAEDLCLTGRIVTAGEAREMGLVDAVTAGDPADAAIAWAREHLSERSASSLRFAVEAMRANLSARLRAELPELERLYVEKLMATHDAREGLDAFLAKRAPVWRHE